MSQVERFAYGPRADHGAYGGACPGDAVDGAHGARREVVAGEAVDGDRPEHPKEDGVQIRPMVQKQGVGEDREDPMGERRADAAISVWSDDLTLRRPAGELSTIRKTLMAASALLSPIGIFAVFAHTLFWTMGLICIAIFFWMFWSISVHSLARRLLPAARRGLRLRHRRDRLHRRLRDQHVAVGKTLDLTHSYEPVFIGIGLLMPIALIAGFSLMRRVEPVTQASGLPLE